MNAKKKKHFIWLSLAAGVFWGTSFPLVKEGLIYISPIWFSNLRLILGFFCLLLLIKRYKIFWQFPKEYWLLGLFNSLGFLFQFLGMQTTAAGKAAFFVNGSLVYVAILSFLIFHEHFSANKTLGVFLALVGIYSLSVGMQPISVLFSGELRGDLLVLASGLSWSIFMVLNKKMVSHPEYSVLETVTLYMFTSALVLLPVSVLFEPFPHSFAWQGWVILLVSSIFSLALPFYLWSLGLTGLTATVSSLLVLVEILVALILSVIFLGESLSLFEMCGALILIIALILASIELNSRSGTLKK